MKTRREIIRQIHLVGFKSRNKLVDYLLDDITPTEFRTLCMDEDVKHNFKQADKLSKVLWEAWDVHAEDVICNWSEEDRRNQPHRECLVEKHIIIDKDEDIVAYYVDVALGEDIKIFTMYRSNAPVWTSGCQGELIIGAIEATDGKLVLSKDMNFIEYHEAKELAAFFDFIYKFN